MKRFMIFLVAMFTLPVTTTVRAEINVVTTSSTYAAIVRAVGGPHVKVLSIMRGRENTHNVKAKPSLMVKLRKADLFMHSGLDAEPWMPMLIKGARRSRLQIGQPGNVNLSRGMTLMEIPRKGGLSRAQGDIHVFGNTHYALDPLNGIIIARTITDALERTDPAHRDEFEVNYESFASRIRELTERLTAEMKPYRNTPVATYHRTWPYFLDRFGLVKIAEVEPKPGIAPGPRHLAQCVASMQSAGAKIVIVETYNSRKNAEAVALRVGGKAVVLLHQVGGAPEVDTYEKLFEYNVNAMLTAFEETGTAPHLDVINVEADTSQDSDS